MTFRCFSVQVADKVAHLQLNRPDELNTMVPEFWRELPQIVGELSAGGGVRALVISSTGRHFSAGMDLSVFTEGHLAGAAGSADEAAPESGRRNAQMRQRAKALQQSFTALEQARMPVLAAVQGGCVGGAVDLVTACDLRYAAAGAFFCVQEINIGMTADVGTLQRLSKIIPEGAARELAYTGRRMDAARAYQLGLVQQVFPDQATLVEAALATAREIAEKSPLAVWGTKVAMNYARDHPVGDSLEQIATWQAGMFQPADMMEAFAARAAGRAGRFPDLPPDPIGL